MTYGKSFFRIYNLPTTTEAQRLVVQIFPQTNDNFSIYFYSYEHENLETDHYSAYLEMCTSDLTTIKEANKVYTKFMTEYSKSALSLVKLLLAMGYKLGDYERYERVLDFNSVFDSLVVTTDNLTNGEFDVYEYGKETMSGYNRYGFFAGTRKQAEKYVKANYQEYSKEQYDKYMYLLKGTFEAKNIKKMLDLHPALKLL